MAASLAARSGGLFQPLTTAIRTQPLFPFPNKLVFPSITSSTTSIAAATATAAWNLLVPLFPSLPSIVFAVPKKKITHRRKRLRSFHKAIREKTSIESCPACARPKLMNHICHNCYLQINRRQKQQLQNNEQEQQ